MDLIPTIIAVVVALAGSGGIVFGALRYNRDDAGKVVAQQASVLSDMRGLNDELQEALKRSREDREGLRQELVGCATEVGKLRTDLVRLQAVLEGFEPR